MSTIYKIKFYYSPIKSKLISLQPNCPYALQQKYRRCIMLKEFILLHIMPQNLIFLEGPMGWHDVRLETKKKKTQNFRSRINLSFRWSPLSLKYYYIEINYTYLAEVASKKGTMTVIRFQEGEEQIHYLSTIPRSQLVNPLRINIIYIYIYNIKIIF